MTARRVERLDVVRVVVELAATVVSVATARAARRERRCNSWPRVIVWRSATRRLAAVAERLGDRMDSIDDEIRALEVAGVLADADDPLAGEGASAPSSSSRSAQVLIGVRDDRTDVAPATVRTGCDNDRVLTRAGLVQFLGRHGLGDNDPEARADHVLATLGVSFCDVEADGWRLITRRHTPTGAGEELVVAVMTDGVEAFQCVRPAKAMDQ